MSFIRSVVLYTAIVLGANPVAADTSALEALREGSMKKLNFHSEPQEIAQIDLVDLTDAPRTMSEFNGKHVVLNFWATWCAPCRKEMPGLQALQDELGGDTFEVVAVATGRNPVAMIQKFYHKEGIKDLTTLRDPKKAFANQMRVLGLPITVILDPEGREIARLQGDAEWDSESAKQIIRALTEPAS